MIVSGLDAIEAIYGQLEDEQPDLAQWIELDPTIVAIALTLDLDTVRRRA